MDIAALKAACLKATPGPWQIGRLGIEPLNHVVDFGTPPTAPFMCLSVPYGVVHSDGGNAANDASFIALANPTSILSLIARYQQMEEALTEVMLWINNWSPDFTDDPEWQDTHAKVTAALEPVQS